MDYGKLAYLKAVDLENMLGATGKTGFGVSVIEFKNLPRGMCDIAEITGRGDIAVFVKSSDSATFYVNGVRICEGNDVFFKVDDGGKVTAQSEGIAKLRLMAFGDVTVAERPGSLYADESETEIAYLICEQGHGEAFSFNKDRFEPHRIFDGDYLSGDVCAYGGGFMFALVSVAGNVILKFGDEQQTLYLGADKVAISADEYAVTVAYTRRGELHYFEVGKFGDFPSVINKVDYSGYIDDVRFVKKSNKLLFSSGGKCFIKDLGDRPGCKDNLLINLMAEVL